MQGLFNEVNFNRNYEKECFQKIFNDSNYSYKKRMDHDKKKWMNKIDEYFTPEIFKDLMNGKVIKDNNIYFWYENSKKNSTLADYVEFFRNSPERSSRLLCACDEFFILTDAPECPKEDVINKIESFGFKVTRSHRDMAYWFVIP